MKRELGIIKLKATGKYNLVCWNTEQINQFLFNGTAVKPERTWNSNRRPPKLSD